MPNVLAYKTFDNSGDANVVLANLTEANAPPLLVLWLYCTTNPNFLKNITADAINGIKFSDIADQLGLSSQCVERVFRLALTNNKDLATAAGHFQDMAFAMNYVSRPPNCIASNTILTLAHPAKAAVTPPVAV